MKGSVDKDGFSFVRISSLLHILVSNINESKHKYCTRGVVKMLLMEEFGSAAAVLPQT